ncbi:MAG: hypothetical protein U1D33_03350, partial [bacterium]|nr:hypothetical protein [bacterium]
DVLQGSALVGGTLLGTIMGWKGLVGFLGDQKIGILIKRINAGVSPRVRAYLVPVLFLSVFAFMAMRQTQELPLDEAWDYRRHMMQELLEGLGVNFVVSGGAFFAINHLLARLGRVPAGKAGATGVLTVAVGAGMLFQEFYSGWRRKQMRQALKEKTYAGLAEIMEMLPTAPEYMRPRLLENVDRKFSILISLNVLEFLSVQQAVKQALNREQIIDNYTSVGMSKGLAMKLAGLMEKEEPLTKSQKEIANAWIGKMAGKEGRAMLPVSVLPAQRRRILALWESDLADIHRFLAAPIPVTIGKNSDGTIPSAQFFHWNIAHTMSLLRRYVALREKLAFTGARNVSADIDSTN